MAVQITQTPLYGDSQNGALPVGQQIIFTIFNSTYVSDYFNLKYLAQVHISDTPINLSLTDDLVATFKTTPNNKGRGIFDFRPLLESYVSADNTGNANDPSTHATSASRYKDILYTLETPHPLHVIDKYCRNANSIRYFAIQFKAEASLTTAGAVGLSTDPVSIIPNSSANTVQYTFFNGVLQQDNYLTLTGANYGYDLLTANLYTAPSSGANGKFLTNAPTTQYANIDDYGTMAFLNFLPATADRITFMRMKYFNSSSVLLGNEDVGNFFVSGGASSLTSSSCNLIYFGGFPANLRNWSTIFQGLVSAGTIQGGFITIQPATDLGYMQQEYRINLNCPDLRGYESVRLTWLNQWGVWDYYTFNKKSVRSTSTNRTTYTQSSGSWNGDTFRIDGYKGGRKNFRVNSTEKIKINTDFVNEAEAAWFEELINSPEVYILNGFDADETAPYNTITNKYVEPVLITTSNYIRKTVANDKLIQYTFEMERNKTQRTQTV